MFYVHKITSKTDIFGKPIKKTHGPLPIRAFEFDSG